MNDGNRTLMPDRSDEFIPTRLSLLSRLQNWDDQASWRDFFDTYWRLIYRAALKSGLTDAEAQDVVQETVITVAKKLQEKKYDPAGGPFKGWLLNTTRWRVVDQKRRRQRDCQPDFARVDDAVSEEIPDESGLNLESIWDEEWQKNLLDAAVEKVKRQVNPKQFQMFDLYVFEKWPVLKVARTLGVNVGLVYLAKHRISALLKKEIKNLEAKMV
jgi:RNA polymerase sigma-70 factor (ECF subfamily)